MNRFDLFSAIGDISEKYILDAKRSSRSYRKPIIGTLAAVAACLVLVLAVNFSYIFTGGGSGMAGPESDANGGNLGGGAGGQMGGAESDANGGNLGGGAGGQMGGAEDAATVSVYYVNEENEIISVGYSDVNEAELLAKWRELSAIPESVGIYLLSTLELSPDGNFAVTVSVDKSIESYYGARDGEKILESLRLTVLSFMEAETEFETIEVNVFLQ